MISDELKMTLVCLPEVVTSKSRGFNSPILTASRLWLYSYYSEWKPMYINDIIMCFCDLYFFYFSQELS